MRKGQKKRVWTPEQKSEIVHKHLDEHISVRTLEREYTADRSVICRWVKEYIAEGESAFIPKGHPGNPFAALHTSKKLSELERLRLIVAKLEIENERLKKGYWVEGVGANKVFVTRPDKSMKSSKH
ncbi:MAG: transposase [Ruminococcaceae bacterium]|nr:transposase [Oscillospiraceae bacterium]